MAAVTKNSREVSTKFKALMKEFHQGVRTSQIDRSAVAQLSALQLILDTPTFDWIPFIDKNMGREDLIPGGFLGTHGRSVAAIYFSESRMDLIARIEEFLPEHQLEFDSETVRFYADMLETIRPLLSENLPLKASEAVKLMRMNGIRHSTWAITWLERNGEVTVRDKVVSWVDSDKRLGIGSRVVPPFQQYWATYADMDAAQRVFYNDRLKPALLAGESIDVEGNLSYIYVLLHDMIRKRRKYASELPRALAAAEVIGHGQVLEPVANSWLADLDFLAGNWSAGFETKERRGLDWDYVIARTLMFPERRVNVDELPKLMLGRDGLSSVGKERSDEVFSQLQQNLDSFHESRGISLLADVWGRIQNHVETGSPLAWEFEDSGPFLDEEAATEKLRGVKTLWRKDKQIAFQGVPGVPELPISWPVQLPLDRQMEPQELLADRLRAAMRRAENAVRERIGVSRVGEGWASELYLLHQIRETFSDVRVRHQGRPNWLGRQSLDIYLPDFNIGIEYQGLQHSQAVDFFGGEEAFSKNQERDARKRMLCAENDCVLIEVFPDYDFATVREQIAHAVSSRPAWYMGREDR